MTTLGKILGQSAGLWRHAEPPILYFRDLTPQGHGIDYVRREVKLEMGTLTDQQPTGRSQVRHETR